MASRALSPGCQHRPQHFVIHDSTFVLAGLFAYLRSQARRRRLRVLVEKNSIHRTPPYLTLTITLLTSSTGLAATSPSAARKTSTP